MKTFDHDLEDQMALEMQARKSELMEAFLQATGEYPQGVPGRNPATWEDQALSVAKNVPPVRRALEAFQRARGRLWAYAVDRDIPMRLAKAFTTKDRRASHLSLDELASEATILIGEALHGFRPGMGNVYSYMRRGVFQALSEESGRSLSPATTPRDAARQAQGDARTQGSADDHLDTSDRHYDRVSQELVNQGLEGMESFEDPGVAEVWAEEVYGKRRFARRCA